MEGFGLADLPEVIKSYYEAFSGLDEEWVLSLCAPNTVFHQPPAGTLVGADGVRATMRVAAEFTRTIETELLGALVSGRYATCRWRAKVTTKTGRDLAFDGLETFLIGDDGRIAEAWVFYSSPVVVGR